MRKLQAKNTYEKAVAQPDGESSGARHGLPQGGHPARPRQRPVPQHAGPRLPEPGSRRSTARRSSRRPSTSTRPTPTYKHNLGIALAQQGKFDEAIAAYKKALSFPTYTTPEVAYYNMGEAYIRLQQAAGGGGVLPGGHTARARHGRGPLRARPRALTGRPEGRGQGRLQEGAGHRPGFAVLRAGQEPP